MRSRPRRASTQVCDPPQPGPYWAIDAGPVRIVGIDTGIVGAIDAEQAEWLRRVSLGSDRPKILVTGKPLIVNGHRTSRRDRRRSSTRSCATPRAQLRDGDRRRHPQLPALPGQAADGRTIQYVVSGGGGAYTHATHQIRARRRRRRDEDEFKCYPLRSDSLARFSQLYDAAACAGGQGLAGALLGGGGDATSSELLQHDADARGAGAALAPRAARRAGCCSRRPPSSGFHRFASEFFDWNDPPFFKQFLRLDADDERAARPLLRRQRLRATRARTRRSRTSSACASEPAREAQPRAGALARRADAARVQRAPGGRAVRDRRSGRAAVDPRLDVVGSRRRRRSSSARRRRSQARRSARRRRPGSAPRERGGGCRAPGA